MIKRPPRGRSVQWPRDLAAADRRWRELFFHDLLAAGFYLGARGYLALTMDVTDDDTGRFLEAVEQFCERRRD